MQCKEVTIRAKACFEQYFGGSGRVRLALLASSVLCALWIGPVRAETSAQSGRAQAIASLIWQSKFVQAIDSCKSLTITEPLNPLGYCLLGMTYHSIGSQYRTDRYADLVTWNLDTAIALAGAESGSQDPDPQRQFLLGSAYGYRALDRSVHCSWWGALKDGHHSCSCLEKAYGLDTTLTDALLGVGDYHYWKSAKSKFFTWLPFVSDKRKQGISEIQRVVQSGTAAALSARKSLMPIYLNEKRYTELISLVDSLSAEGFSDPSCLLHKTKAEIELGKWESARQTLDKLRLAWDRSPFVDRCGTCELQYLKARIFLGQGDTTAAQVCIQEILATRDSCKPNVYYRETASKATDLRHK